MAGRGVSVDAEGTLFNEGIALSRDALAQLEAHLALVHGEERRAWSTRTRRSTGAS